MKILIQDSWDEPEDEELKLYLKESGADITITSSTDIKLYKYSDFDIVFVDTGLVHSMLNTIEFVPTYPICFNTLYHRDIQKKTLQDCIKSKDISFIKPINNNKSFEALVFNPCNKYDIYHLLENISLYDYVYSCEVVEFVNEFRMYVLGKELHGIQESSDYVIDYEKILRYKPPQDFLDCVLLFNVYPACIIDIGMMKNGKWAVVEVNPPFSISSYDYPISKYVDYCHKASKTL
jgi:hypothetical protein